MSLIIDIETTGLPSRINNKYYLYSELDKYNNSRIVQISFMLCNEKLENIELKDFIVKRDNFSISNYQFHGITNDISTKKGIQFIEIAKILSKYLKHISHIISHNANFDINIINSELHRYGLNTIIDELLSKKILCTMEHTKYLVGIYNNRGIKYPSLSELYNFVLNKNMENAHNSMYDVINLHSIIKNLYDMNKLNHISNYIPIINEIESNQIESNETKSNEIKTNLNTSNETKSNETKSNETKNNLNTSNETKSNETTSNEINELSKLTMEELYDKCIVNNIKRYKTMKKETIIKKLNEINKYCNNFN